ncbi:hypothetical protein OVA24_09780 [Luteolibacter sp. SL250]|uniref:hypothetical protein n=1 Tax=Luteolibacter sp. SL250 TaxID=2995170 RepID=UPI00226FA9EB|nr:hypothetical protein [Luteolibacter sp. SL250]WAC21674.1 hypothetical protein OVA24_09780 [Luteolibacter sp. SL250]
MRIEYEATLDDVSEPMIRHYLRGRNYARQRFREPMWGGVGAMIGYYFISVLSKQSADLWWVYPLVFIVGYAVVFIPIRHTVSRRIRNYVKRETGPKLPIPTSFEVTDRQLHCESMKADMSFSLEDLSDATEDADRLEFVFGDAGVCTIPLRVFRDREEKEEFVRRVKREGLR